MHPTAPNILYRSYTSDYKTRILVACMAQIVLMSLQSKIVFRCPNSGAEILIGTNNLASYAQFQNDTLGRSKNENLQTKGTSMKMELKKMRCAVIGEANALCTR